MTAQTAYRIDAAMDVLLPRPAATPPRVRHRAADPAARHGLSDRFAELHAQLSRFPR